MAYRDQLKSPISTFISPKGRFGPLIFIFNLNDYRIISRIFHHLQLHFYSHTFSMTLSLEHSKQRAPEFPGYRNSSYFSINTKISVQPQEFKTQMSQKLRLQTFLFQKLYQKLQTDLIRTKTLTFAQHYVFIIVCKHKS